MSPIPPTGSSNASKYFHLLAKLRARAGEAVPPPYGPQDDSELPKSDDMIATAKGMLRAVLSSIGMFSHDSQSGVEPERRSIVCRRLPSGSIGVALPASRDVLLLYEIRRHSRAPPGSANAALLRATPALVDASGVLVRFSQLRPVVPARPGLSPLPAIRESEDRCGEDLLSSSRSVLPGAKCERWMQALKLGGWDKA